MVNSYPFIQGAVFRGRPFFSVSVWNFMLLLLFVFKDRCSTGLSRRQYFRIFALLPIWQMSNPFFVICRYNIRRWKLFASATLRDRVGSAPKINPGLISFQRWPWGPSWRAHPLKIKAFRFSPVRRDRPYYHEYGNLKAFFVIRFSGSTVLGSNNILTIY